MLGRFPFLSLKLAHCVPLAGKILFLSSVVFYEFIVFHIYVLRKCVLRSACEELLARKLLGRVIFCLEKFHICDRLYRTDCFKLLADKPKAN
jgi:hypothetical protein